MSELGFSTALAPCAAMTSVSCGDNEFGAVLPVTFELAATPVSWISSCADAAVVAASAAVPTSAPLAIAANRRRVGGVGMGAPVGGGGDGLVGQPSPRFRTFAPPAGER